MPRSEQMYTPADLMKRLGHETLVVGLTTLTVFVISVLFSWFNWSNWSSKDTLLIGIGLLAYWYISTFVQYFYQRRYPVSTE